MVGLSSPFNAAPPYIPHSSRTSPNSPVDKRPSQGRLPDANSRWVLGASLFSRDRGVSTDGLRHKPVQRTAGMIWDDASCGEMGGSGLAGVWLVTGMHRYIA